MTVSSLINKIYRGFFPLKNVKIMQQSMARFRWDSFISLTHLASQVRCPSLSFATKELHAMFSLLFSSFLAHLIAAIAGVQTS